MSVVAEWKNDNFANPLCDGIKFNATMNQSGRADQGCLCVYTKGSKNPKTYDDCACTSFLGQYSGYGQVFTISAIGTGATVGDLSDLMYEQYDLSGGHIANQDSGPSGIHAACQNVITGTLSYIGSNSYEGTINFPEGSTAGLIFEVDLTEASPPISAIEGTLFDTDVANGGRCSFKLDLVQADGVTLGPPYGIGTIRFGTDCLTNLGPLVPTDGLPINQDCQFCDNQTHTEYATKIPRILWTKPHQYLVQVPSFTVQEGTYLLPIFIQGQRLPTTAHAGDFTIPGSMTFLPKHTVFRTGFAWWEHYLCGEMGVNTAGYLGPDQVIQYDDQPVTSFQIGSGISAHTVYHAQRAIWHLVGQVALDPGVIRSRDDVSIELILQLRYVYQFWYRTRRNATGELTQVFEGYFQNTVSTLIWTKDLPICNPWGTIVFSNGVKDGVPIGDATMQFQNFGPSSNLLSTSTLNSALGPFPTFP